MIGPGDGQQHRFRNPAGSAEAFEHFIHAADMVQQMPLR